MMLHNFENAWEQWYLMVITPLEYAWPPFKGSANALLRSWPYCNLSVCLKKIAKMMKRNYIYKQSQKKAGRLSGLLKSIKHDSSSLRNS